MPSIWPVNLTPDDKQIVTELARRRAALGLSGTFADTIRSSVRLALTATDDQLKAGAVECPSI